MLLLLLVVPLLFQTLDVNASGSFVNKNGITISNVDYNKLKSVGYTDDEILTLTVEKYNKVSNMNIISQKSNTKYLYEIENQRSKEISTLVVDAPIQLYEESTITNGYVKVDTYGTFYKNLGTLGEFFR